MQIEENRKLSFGILLNPKTLNHNYGSYTNQVFEREYLFAISKNL